MKRLVLSVVAAAAVLTAVPAFADDYGGFSVRIGRDHDWDRDHGSDWYHRHHFGFRDRNECRRVVVRERLPNGNVVIRKHFRCD